MSIDPEQLQVAVLAGDARQVRILLRGATQADRAACAECGRRWFKLVSRTGRPAGG